MNININLTFTIVLLFLSVVNAISSNGELSTAWLVCSLVCLTKIFSEIEIIKLKKESNCKQ